MKKLLFILLLLPLFADGQVRNFVAQFPIDAPSMENLNDGIRGRWKFVEDTNKGNFYEVIRGKPYAEDKYHLKFWDRGGKNPTYESNMHFSKIGNILFINVPYFEGDFSHQGFFFLRVLDINPDFTKMTAELVHDTNLWNLKQAEVKQRISQNINNRAYYSDTLHFYKVSR